MTSHESVKLERAANANHFLITESFCLQLSFRLFQVQGLPGFGVLTAMMPGVDQETNFCVKYYPKLYNMSDKGSAITFNFDQFVYLPTANSCDPDDTRIPEDLNDKFVMVSVDADEGFGNCTIVERAQILADRGAIGLISDRPVKSKFNISETYDANIIVVSLYQRRDRDSLVKLQGIRPSGQFYLYAPEDDPKGFDSSLIVILCMAVFTVAGGSAWSGYAKKNLFEAMNKAKIQVSNEDDADNGDQDHGEEEEHIYAHKESSNRITEEVSLRITPLIVLGFVCGMCMLLVLLYFFYDELGKYFYKINQTTKWILNLKRILCFEPYLHV